MNEKNQTKFMLILGLILLLIVGGILYFAFRDRGSESDFTLNPFASGGSGSLQFVGNSPIPNDDYSLERFPVSDEEAARLVQLSKEPTIGVGISPDGDRVRYFRRGVGHIYESAFHGQTGEARISNITVRNVVRASWTSTGDTAAITTLNNDIQRDFWVKPTGTTTIETDVYAGEHLSRAFSPDGTRLASLSKTGTSYSLNISNTDGSGGTTIFSTPIPDYEVAWAGDSLISLKTKTSGFAPTILETMSRTGRNPSVLTSGKYGFDVVWSPNGTKYISSETDSRGQDIKTSVFNTESGVRTTLTFATLPEKCVFSMRTKNNIYCAVPKNLSREPLPDAWWKGTVEFDDELWRIDLISGSAELLLENGGFDMTDLLLTPDENYIIFINKDDSSLWSYRLFHDEEAIEESSEEVEN
ncbi:MAG: hypothetical protein O2794_02740 [bacterium]|nr:hypothetical protein [bacterium]